MRCRRKLQDTDQPVDYQPCRAYPPTCSQSQAALSALGELETAALGSCASYSSNECDRNGEFHAWKLGLDQQR